MTGEEWKECKDRDKMLRVLRKKGSDRKRRLLACALCRNIWHLIDEGPCRRAVEASERYSDMQISQGNLVAAQKATWAVVQNWDTRSQANLAASRVARVVEVDEAVKLAVLAAEVEIEESKKRVATSLKSLNATHCNLFRCIFGNPFRPIVLDQNCLTATVKNLAEVIYQERTFDRLPILADALEEAGCGQQDILAHCRQPGPHVRGCWVVDLILGKE